jgi:hypothetical protein
MTWDSRLVCDDPDDWEGDDGCCAWCGGTGVDDNSCECETVEDTCCCLMPIPRTCHQCGGDG